MWFLGVVELCSFTEQTLVDPLLWAGCRARCEGYRDGEGASCALEGAVQSVLEGGPPTGVGATSTSGRMLQVLQALEGGVRVGESGGRLHRGSDI